jgi:hypothetical protein
MLKLPQVTYFDGTQAYQKNKPIDYILTRNPSCDEVSADFMSTNFIILVHSDI